jgi:hypothetical protein
VGFQFTNQRGHTRKLGYSIVQRPANYGHAHVRLSLLAQALNTVMGNTGRKVIKLGGNPQRMANFFINMLKAQLSFTLLPLMRCKNWKRNNAVKATRCTCQYCRALYVVRNQQEILEG